MKKILFILVFLSVTPYLNLKAETIQSFLKSKNIFKLKDCVDISEKRKIFSYKKVKICSLQPNSAFLYLGILLKKPHLSRRDRFKSISLEDAEQFILKPTSYGVASLRSDDKIDLVCKKGSFNYKNKDYFLKIDRDISQLLEQDINSFEKGKVRYIMTLPLSKKSRYQFCIAYNRDDYIKPIYITYYSKTLSSVVLKNLIVFFTKNKSPIINFLKFGGAVLKGDRLDKFAKSYIKRKTIGKIKNILYEKLNFCKKGTRKFICSIVVDIYSDILVNIYNI